jgi:hypothetical protein
VFYYGSRPQGLFGPRIFVAHVTSSSSSSIECEGEREREKLWVTSNRVLAGGGEAEGDAAGRLDELAIGMAGWFVPFFLTR